MNFDTPSFAAWKKRRAASAGDDQDYRDFVSAMTGTSAEAAAGVTHELIPGGAEVPSTLTDDAAFAHYMDVISGRAARRQAEEDVRRDRRDRQQEHARHAQMMGYPPREQYRGD